MLNLSLSSLKRAVGASALLGALTLTGCMMPPQGSETACKSCSKHGGMAATEAATGTESTLITPPETEAMTGGVQTNQFAGGGRTPILTEEQRTSLKNAICNALSTDVKNTIKTTVQNTIASWASSNGVSLTDEQKATIQSHHAPCP